MPVVVLWKNIPFNWGLVFETEGNAKTSRTLTCLYTNYRELKNKWLLYVWIIKKQKESLIISWNFPPYVSSKDSEIINIFW